MPMKSSRWMERDFAGGCGGGGGSESESESDSWVREGFHTGTVGEREPGWLVLGRGVGLLGGWVLPQACQVEGSSHPVRGRP